MMIAVVIFSVAFLSALVCFGALVLGSILFSAFLELIVRQKNSDIPNHETESTGFKFDLPEWCSKSMQMTH